MNAIVINCSSKYNIAVHRLTAWLRGRGLDAQMLDFGMMVGDLDLQWADQVFCQWSFPGICPWSLHWPGEGSAWVARFTSGVRQRSTTVSGYGSRLESRSGVARTPARVRRSRIP